MTIQVQNYKNIQYPAIQNLKYFTRDLDAFAKPLTMTLQDVFLSDVRSASCHLKRPCKGETPRPDLLRMDTHFI